MARAKKKTWTVKALLQATLDLFEAKPELWGQGSLGGKPSTLVCDKAGNCFCVVTGIHHVFNGGDGTPLPKYDDNDDPNPQPIAARAIVHFAIANKLGVERYRVPAVTKWNDHAARQRDEVIAAFRKAIATRYRETAV